MEIYLYTCQVLLKRGKVPVIIYVISKTMVASFDSKGALSKAWFLVQNNIHAYMHSESWY